MDLANLSRSTMDLADTPLPPSANADDASLAAAGSLVASPVPAVAQDASTALLTWCRRFVIGVINIFVPTPVRQNWIFIFTTIYNKVAAYPAKYRYALLALVVWIALAEWEQPGYVPRPRQFSNAIFGFLCATLLIFGILATEDFIETRKWPWQEDGWVWPWQAWLWQGTAYDLGASTNTSAPDLRSPSPAATPFAFRSSPPVMPSSSTTPFTPTSDTPINKAARFDFSMPPPPAISRPAIVIPPTPQLPGGLRPVYLPPPTPAQIHRSGILGESPVGRRFENFSGNYFQKQQDDMKAISEWSRTSGKPLSAFRKYVDPEKRAGEDYENEKTVKKALLPDLIQISHAATEPIINDSGFAKDAGYESDHEN